MKNSPAEAGLFIFSLYVALLADERGRD